jgi:hypothetical protein
MQTKSILAGAVLALATAVSANNVATITANPSQVSLKKENCAEPLTDQIHLAISNRGRRFLLLLLPLRTAGLHLCHRGPRHRSSRRDHLQYHR